MRDERLGACAYKVIFPRGEALSLFFCQLEFRWPNATRDDGEKDVPRSPLATGPGKPLVHRAGRVRTTPIMLSVD